MLSCVPISVTVRSLGPLNYKGQKSRLLVFTHGLTTVIQRPQNYYQPFCLILKSLLLLKRALRSITHCPVPHYAGFYPHSMKFNPWIL